MQIEFTQGSFRSNSSRGPHRENRASSDLNAEPDTVLSGFISFISKVQLEHVTQRAEETEAHAELGSSDANAAPIAEFVHLIRYVDHIQPGF